MNAGEAVPLSLLRDGPPAARPIVVLAHGAGAPMDSAFMNAIAAGLAARQRHVVRFEFPYMRARRGVESRRKPPDREPVLRACWQAVIDELGGPAEVVIGGKSMGGRIASLIADEAGVAGLVCLGYPFHPAGKPQTLRTAHLRRLRTRTLIVQGERDALGTRAEVDGYELSPAIAVAWMTDGDHSLKPRVRSGATAAANLAAAVAAIDGFVGRC